LTPENLLIIRYKKLEELNVIGISVNVTLQPSEREALGKDGIEPVLT
jgi:hypothetical protein